MNKLFKIIASITLTASGTTMLLPHNNHHSVSVKMTNNAVSETPAEAIANKLANKTIKLLNVSYVGQDITNPTMKAAIGNALVSQKILTKDEVQYVSWDSYKTVPEKNTGLVFHVNVGLDLAYAYGITLQMIDDPKSYLHTNKITNSSSIIHLGANYIGHRLSTMQDQFRKDMAAQGLIRNP